MEKFLFLLNIIGHISTVIVLILAVVAIVSWINGIKPVIIGLGQGLSKRKIAIFAKGDQQKSLENLLNDSKLFKKKNIIFVTSLSELGRSEKASIFLVNYHDWIDEFERIFEKSTDQTAIIIYSPKESGKISKSHIQLISEYRNSTITNFRGRLLSDLVSAMITSNYF